MELPPLLLCARPELVRTNLHSDVRTNEVSSPLSLSLTQLDTSDSSTFTF